MECSQCGANDIYRMYYDVLSPDGVIVLCGKCKAESDYPVLRKKSNFEVQSSEKRQTVYERMQRISGVTPSAKPKEDVKMEELNKNLRKMVENNFNKAMSEKTLPTNDLIDNFHWIVMRARRMKKWTMEQLAREIGEPEVAVKMLEQGRISASSPRIVKKVEDCLNVRLRKSDSFFPDSDIEPVVNESLKEVKIEGTDMSFDPTTAKSIRIGDLKRMKEREEYEKRNINEPKKDENLSDADMDDIIYGRR